MAETLSWIDKDTIQKVYTKPQEVVTEQINLPELKNKLAEVDDTITLHEGIIEQNQTFLIELRIKRTDLSTQIANLEAIPGKPA